jgi:glycosyltransferase involved in cell wall biosynthesis
MPSPAIVLYVNHISQIFSGEESLLDLVTQLDRDRFVPVLACPPGDLAARAVAAGIRTEPLPVPRFHRTRNPLKVSSDAISWVVAANQLRRIIRDLSPRIVHANSATAQLFTGAIAQKAGIPCAWHSRDLRRLPFPAGTLCRYADRIIAVSEAVAEFLAVSGLSRPKVTRIYGGIDPALWRARVTGKDVRAELGLAAGDRILLMAAQLFPWHRHEDAIRAMSFISQKEPSARLVLAGSDPFGERGEMAKNLERVADQAGVRKSVAFIGRRDDVPDLMNAAELILIPSDAEPFGRAALEAMALGKPVVGTRAGGLPEVVRDGETGLLVVPRFPESLAEACLRVLRNRHLANSLGEAGRARVESAFHIARTVRETTALYDSMLHPPLKWIRPVV